MLMIELDCESAHRGVNLNAWRFHSFDDVDNEKIAMYQKYAVSRIENLCEFVLMLKTAAGELPESHVIDTLEGFDIQM